MIEVGEFFCRPDQNHWCVQCCQAINCCLLQKLPDGKRGCIAYNGRSPEGFQKRSICDLYHCLWNEPPEIKELIHGKVLSLPPGEFRMWQIIKDVKNQTTSASLIV